MDKIYIGADLLDSCYFVGDDKISERLPPGTYFILGETSMLSGDKYIPIMRLRKTTETFERYVLAYPFDKIRSVAIARGNIEYAAA